MNKPPTNISGARRVPLSQKTLLCAVLALLAAVALLLWWTSKWADRQMRDNLLQQARLAMQMISPDDVRSLVGSKADLTSAHYEKIKRQLLRARQANPRCRFFYLLGRANRPASDQLFFYVDSEPADSKDYSPPGQVYEEASERDWRVFKTKTAEAYGPSKDRWGTWVSALVPMLDPAKGELIAVLGMDIDAQTWNRQVALYSALPAGLAFVLLSGLFSVLYLLLLRADRRVALQQELLRKNEELLKFAMEGANDGIWDIDLRTGMISLSPRCYEMMGYDPAKASPLSRTAWEQMVHPDDRAAILAALNEHLDGRTPFIRAEHRVKTGSGGYLWVLARGKVSQRDGAGAPLRLTGTYTDISARKEAESQSQAAQLETARLLIEAQQSRQALLSVLEDQKKAEGALKEERLRLASIIQGTQVGTWEWNVPTGELVINRRWAEILGYTLEELAPVTFDTWASLVHPDDLKASNEQLQRHFKGEIDYYAQECRMRHKDGHWIWVLDCGCLASRTEDGQPLMACGMHQDITERKLTEIYHRLSSTVLTAINGSDDFRNAIQLILEALKRTTESDAAAVRLQQSGDFPYFAASGMPPDFQAEENALAARDAKGDLCRDADGRVCLECTCGLVLEGKTDPASPLFTPAGSFWTNDSSALLALPADKDPRLRPRNRCVQQGYLSVALIPIRAKTEVIGLLQLAQRRKNGFTLFAVKALEEIADRIGDALVRQRAEAEHKRLMAAIEQSGEIILITDPLGIIQYVNPAFTSVTGYSRQEIAGKTPRILKSGQHDESFYRELWQTITSGKVWNGRLTNKRKDGSLYTEDASISPVRDETGQIVNFVAVKRDITEHLQMSAQLLQAQKMESVGRLAGGVAHDFNNMLAVILGNTELALSQTAPTQPLFNDLQEIRKAAERSADLTRQLLAFARKQIVVPKVIDLNDAVAGMLKMLRRLIGEDIELSWQPGPGALTVKLDPSQIDQILANLAVNARDAIKGVGKVTIETRSATFGQSICAEHVDAVPGDYVMLAVGDTGCGMDKTVLDHLFEPFFTTKKVGEGTGLGLATVYGIVRQNRGFITVFSEPGLGTTFRIYLPRFKEKAGAAPAPAAAAVPSRGHEVVLLVEDEPAILNMTQAMLEKLGYRVLAADTPDRALELAADNQARLDLLLTDMVMPGMNGEALARRLQSTHPRLKCLFMSGYTSQAINHTSLPHGKVYFIQKPFSMKELGDQMREVLDHK